MKETRTTIFPIARQAAICLALLLGPALQLLPLRIWNWPLPYLLVLGGAVLAYLLTLASLPRKQPSLATVLLHFGAWFGLWLLAVTFLQSGRLPSVLQLPGFDRMRILLTLAIALAGLLLTARLRSFWPSNLAAGALAAAVLVAHVAYRMAPRAPEADPLQGTPAEVAQLDTSLYQLKLTEYPQSIPELPEARPGGGLATWGADNLLATGDGRLYVFNKNDQTGELWTRELPIHAPLNAEEYEAGAGRIVSGTASTNVDAEKFRVAGVLVQDHDGMRRLLVSHHHWDNANSCFLLRLSMMEAPQERFEEVASQLQWKTVFDARPCLKLNTTRPGPRFEGFESGGQIAFLGPDEILLTVGDHAFDGVTRPERVLAQDPSASYGKVMRINLRTGAADVYSSGHRNPQGLHITAAGDIWATEHGPRGGDELNRIVKGDNYGWPVVTYGTQYSGWNWPSNPQQGRHEKYEPPVYAFVPSVGLSALTSITSRLFPSWRGDLLLASLKGQSLYRARVRDGRVIFVESMRVNRRIRDLQFGPRGRLLMMTDTNGIIVAEPTDAGDGAALAGQCRGCHDMNWPDDPSSALGPNIFRIIDRPVASRTDFPYSEGLRELGGVWTTERLDEFLANPQQYAPGTSMAFPGIADAEQRKKLITFLGSTAQN